MDIRITLLALAGSVAFSTAALAAAGAPNGNRPASHLELADRCAVLESQFKDTVGDHEQGSAYDQAMQLDSLGTAECNSNEGDIGVERLNQALIDLGVAPSS